jgi:hypothetical protein
MIVQSKTLIVWAHKDCKNPYCRWICSYNHTVIWGMARTLPKMNQPYIVLLIPEAPVAHS